MIHCEVRYTGRVQGVGFRYTVQKLAAPRQVTGYVRNRSDGSVHLVVEGTSDEVDRLLTAVAERMAGHIDQADVVRSEPTGEFDSFTIRH